MKKLFDSKFLIISALSIITLILLIVFSFFLFDRDESEFLKSGYIINPLSSVSEKYFFNEGTGYRENLSSMVVFNDIDDKEVKVLRDSFVHYEGGSIALLKKGAILDIDSIHDNMALFYNISSDSIIERDGNAYYVNSLNGKINLKDFIVRISDNKYLVAGNVKLSYVGSPSLIEGEYFEIVYSEAGIVNVENKEFKYELSAEGTKIYIGDYVIDLGTKVLSYKDNDIMSITAITIDGNENVEIIPKKEEPKSSSVPENEPPLSSSENVPDNPSEEPSKSTEEPKPSSSQNEPDSSGSEGGSEGGGGGNLTPINKNTPKISLKDASIGPTNIDVVFDVENKEDNVNYMLQVINAETGNTIDITAEVLDDTPISVNLLTPSTKYLLAVVNRETKEQYFQKVFKTDTFGVNLEKAYAKENSITYKLNIGSDTKINDATLTLYKFDEDSGETVETGKSIKLSDIPMEEGKEEYYFTFDGLESDSIYTAVLDNFALQSVNFRDIYSKSVTSLTLKEMPTFPNENSELMSITEGDRSNDFKLYIGKINDPDNAITKYTYYIYDTKNTADPSDDVLALNPIVKDNASPITVTLGKLDNELKDDINYYYKVVVEYFDNEKYMEYETIDSAPFIKTEMPTITVVPLADEGDGDERISYNTYNQIGAKIYINDKGCNIKLPERPGVNCSANNVVKVIITKTDRTTGQQISVYDEIVNFNYDGDSVVSPNIVVGDLEMGTTYYINAYTIYSSSEDGALERIPHASDSSKTITTKTLATLSMEWKKPTVISKIIEVGAKITGTSADDTMSVEDSISKITKLTFKIFNGDVRDKVDISEPLDVGYAYGNIYDQFGIDYYSVTNENIFNLTVDYLKEHNNGKVNSQYTIAVYAYYGDDANKPIMLNNSVFLCDVFYLEDLPDQDILVEPIRNSDKEGSGNYFDDISASTVVGYTIQARMVNDLRLPIQSVFYNVLDRNGNPVKFYIKKDNGEIDMEHPKTIYEIEFLENEKEHAGAIVKSFEIFLDYGLVYGNSDDLMRRGNEYFVGYYLRTKNAETNLIYDNYPRNEESPIRYGLYEKQSPNKFSPSMKMYVSESTANSITYKYYISDPDTAIWAGRDENLNTNYIYYKVDGMEEKFVQLDEQNNQFTINNINVGDIYDIYYKLGVMNTGNMYKDIVALNDPKFKDFRFDGLISSDSSFKYKVKNQPDKNRVAIIIESNDDLLDSTLQYDITFEATNKNINPYIYSTSKLSECSGVDGVSEGNRCVFVDYVTLKKKGMKSNGATGDFINIQVTVKAAYDTGITGYNVGNIGYGNNKDYFIFKQVSRRDTESKYLILNSGGLSNWTRASEFVPGYYQYYKDLRDNLLNPIAGINLRRLDVDIEQSNIALLLNSYGYVRATQANEEAINPRIVTLNDMDQDGSNEFNFSSITPKAAPTKNDEAEERFLSGAGLKLNVSGIDLTDFRVPSLYIEIWSDEESAIAGDLSATVRPSVEVSGLEDGITSIDKIIIDGLHSYDEEYYPWYYYKIYAKLYSAKLGDNDSSCIEMINNKTCVKYVQLYHLFDEEESSELVTVPYYKFRTRGAGDLVNTYDIELNGADLDIQYGERKITTNIGLNAYGKGYTDYRDYDLKYYLIPNIKGSTCASIVDNLSSEIIVLRSDLVTIPKNGKVKDIIDVYNNDKLVYGTTYRMCVFADYNFYVESDSESGFDSIRQMALFEKDGNSNFAVRLDSLKEPSFKVIRESKLTDNGQYVVDINVIVDDPDKTLLSSELNPYSEDVNGIYKISMTTDDDSAISAGTLQSFTDDGFVDVDTNYLHTFDASEVNSRFRITDLNSSTPYKLRVCGNAYVKNADKVAEIDPSEGPFVNDDPKNSEDDSYVYHIVCTRYYSITTVDSRGISLGNVLYSINKNKIIATFLGGSNLFTRGWNAEAGTWSGSENENYINYLMYTIVHDQSGLEYTGEFALGQPGDEEHYFEYSPDSDEWQLALLENMNNTTGDIYNIKIMLWDKSANGHDGDAIYENTGKQVYIADRGN